MQRWFRTGRLPSRLPVVVVALVLALAACGSDSPTTPTSGSGTLTVAVKDGPFGDATALLVTFSEVSVHSSGGGWVTLPLAGGAASRTCDVKRLLGAQDVLGVGTLAAGHYTQLRVTVSSARLYFAATTSGPVCAPTLTPLPVSDAGVSVDVPSGTLMLNREFDVPSRGATTILLDIDGDQSVHATGNGKFMMTPVIGVVSVQ